MKRFLLLLCLFVVPGHAGAQGIFVEPSEPQEHKLFAIGAPMLENLPEGAYLYGKGWDIKGLSSGASIDLASPPDKPYGPFLATGAPGRYSASFRGVILKDVTFTDGNGEPVTLTSFLGYLEENVEFTIAGDGDDDDGEDDDNDPFPDKWQIVMIYETDPSIKRSESQADLLTSLTIRKNLAARGHSVRRVVDDEEVDRGVSPEFEPFIRAYKESKYVGKDVCIIAPIEGGKPVIVFELPNSVEELLLKLEGGE